jgi:ferredoxin
MLQSMTENPRPTRAEVSDVAGAIFGGTDAVMLSGETATGKYPLEAVRQMDAIADHSEKFLESTGALQPVLHSNPVYSITDAVCHGANSAARDLAAGAVIIATTTGRTALLFSKYRFPGAVVGTSDDPAAVRRMALFWGIEPMQVRKCRNAQDLLAVATEAATSHKLVAAGDTVVFIAGAPLGKTGGTNVLLVHQVPPAASAAAAGLIRGATKFGTIAVDGRRCTNCGVCVGDCPAGIFELQNGKISIRRRALTGCLGDWHCVKVCPVGAISVASGRRKRGAP